MWVLIKIARHVLLPAAIWVGLIAWAHSYQLQHNAPETSYIIVTVFAACWLIRSLILCFLWPLASGIYYAAGQLTGLAIFNWWPTLVLDRGVTLRLDGPSFGLPPESSYASLIINGVILANRFLPLILVVSAVALSLGSIVVLMRRSATELDVVAPEPATPQKPQPPAPAAKPVRTGYIEIPDNPLDAFR